MLCSIKTKIILPASMVFAGSGCFVLVTMIFQTINAGGYARERFSFSVLLPIFVGQFVW